LLAQGGQSSSAKARISGSASMASVSSTDWRRSRQDSVAATTGLSCDHSRETWAISAGGRGSCIFASRKAKR
jgi:hypothetical protein